jgi:hypothetical protein
MDDSWEERGAHSFARAHRPAKFVEEHVAPLLGQQTRSHENNAEGRAFSQAAKAFSDEQEFWREAASLTFSKIRLNAFRLSDWFPRSPGVYWSRYGVRARQNVYGQGSVVDSKLGPIFEPRAKMSLIEEGGIGTIRLRPRRIDGTDCWFATAVKGSQCAGGIPLLVPHTFIKEGAIEWGGTANIFGTVRFLQDAELNDVAASVHHASPVIIFVERIEGRASRVRLQDLTITPVALFDLSPSKRSRHPDRYHPDFGYTFVQSTSDDEAVTDAADWIALYADKYGGKVLTNFDERLPTLADAPLSYQRLVNKTYDRMVVANFHLEKLADRIDSVTTEYTNYGQVGAMGDRAKSDGNVFRRMFRRKESTSDKKPG